jgi:serine protein kinase
MDFNFQDLILKDRDARQHQHYDVSFLEYLNMVKKDPDIAKLAHKRMYDIIVSSGVESIKTEDHQRLKRIYGKETIKRYKFFESDFYGIDKTIMEIVRYFHSAAMRGEESRQVLYMVGPVGSGKSSLMESLKKALEQHPPIFVLKDCPMREEPLHLIPKHLRDEFSQILGVNIEGDLCPVCRYRLIHEYQGEYENFRVVTTDFSIRSRKGIAVVPPVDPNNQDTSVLVGSVDISKMDLYPEDDPRVLSLNGAFNAGNRGLVEFIEIFKNDVEYLHTILTATQEKSIPSPGKNSMIYFDGIILAHSNESEWNKFKSDHTNEAILDRIVKIEVPYCLELDEEVKIYQKILKRSNFKAHIAPHTIEMASIFAIISRLTPSSKVDIISKMHLYNGEEVLQKDATQRVDIRELREEAGREGFEGISTRFIIFIPFCTSCSIAGTWPFSRSGKTITPFFRSSSWCHPGAVFTINKAIFLKAPDRNLDDLVFALSNNALFCNYITNIFLDGFFHQLPVTSPVFSAPVPALAIIITENGQMDHSPKFFCI